MIFTYFLSIIYLFQQPKTVRVTNQT